MVAKLPVPLPVTSPVSVIVWSPVLLPDSVVIPSLLLIVAVVSSPVFVPSAVPEPPAFESSAACKSVWSASVPVIVHQAGPPQLGKSETGHCLVIPSELSTKTIRSSVVGTHAGSQDIFVGDIISKLCS